MKYAITISRPVQIGENDFKQVRSSMVATDSTTIGEMFDFANKCGIHDANINDFIFSELYE